MYAGDPQSESVLQLKKTMRDARIFACDKLPMALSYHHVQITAPWSEATCAVCSEVEAVSLQEAMETEMETSCACQL
jgi:hypothetical protein